MGFFRFFISLIFFALTSKALPPINKILDELARPCGQQVVSLGIPVPASTFSEEIAGAIEHRAALGNRMALVWMALLTKADI